MRYERASASVWLRRVSLSLFGAVVAALLATGADALYAGSGKNWDGAALARFCLVDFGLIVPVAYFVGGAIGASLIALDPRRSWAPGELRRALDDTSPERRARRSAVALISLPGTALGMIFLGHVAKAVLASGVKPRAAGAELAVACAATLVWLVMAALALGPPLGEVALRLRRGGPPPSLVIGVSVLIAVAIVAAGVTSGTPAGDTGFLGILGVLKRDELDLRPPFLLVLVTAGAALAPGLLRRVPTLIAFGVAIVFAQPALRDGAVLDASPSLTGVIEREAPLGKIGLAMARRVTDADHDGFSRTYGGGDCDDHDPHINPGAFDVPGNGIDEDCSGSDAPVAAPPTRAASAAPQAAKVKAPEGLNLVLITVDTLRGDLGFAGYHPYAESVSPNLDALAQKATVYENAYSFASYTGKSVGPLLSGKYPSETHRSWDHLSHYPADDILISERLRAAGIRTVSVQAHAYLDKRSSSGFERGFDVIDSSAADGFSSFGSFDASSCSDRLTDAVVRVLSKPENGSKQFFTWVHYLDPHADYVHHSDVPDFGQSKRSLYDGEVAFTDKHIGRLLDWLASQPFGPKTAVMVTADHGEAFGEHHMFRHGLELWDELIRVPLLVYVPGAPPHRVKARRSAVDVVPTILDIFNVTPKTGSGASDFLSGVSLLPEVMTAPASEDVRDVFIDMPAGPYNEERRALIHDGKKLLVAGSVRFQLYDLEEDPGEKTDLASTDRDALAAARAYYETFRSHLHEVFMPRH